MTPSGALIWAGANASTSGNFAGVWHTYGGYYTWSAAQSACPSGWRPPSAQEFTWLASGAYTTNTYTASGMVMASKYLPNSTAIFPLAGYLSTGTGTTADNGATTRGDYWASTSVGSSAYSLVINATSAQVAAFGQSHGFSVRCVRDCYRGYVN